MSKNLTRKGLALGAVVALGTSLFAAAPAFAANEVVLAPTSGTSTSFITGQTFSLTANVGSTIPSSSYAQLKTKVVNNSAIAFTTSASQTDATLTGTGAKASSDTSTVIGGTGATSGIQTVTLATAAADAGNFTVTSWLDANGNGAIDSTELASAPVTVTFIKQADVTSTTTITAPIAADTTASASIVFNNINNEQLTNTDVALYFTDGTGATLAGASPAGSSASSEDLIPVGAWSTTDGNFKATSGTVTALVKDTAIKVQPYFHHSAANAAGFSLTADKIGTVATSAVVARAINTFVASAVQSATAGTTAAGTPATANVAVDAAYDVQVQAKDATTPTALAVAGSAVSYKVELTSGSLSATAGSVKSLTVGGTTYTSNAALPGATGVAKLTGTTDANGKVTVHIATSGFVATNAVKVTFYAENFTAAIQTTSTAATYTGYITNAQGNTVVTTDGTPVNLNVAAYDQFGNALPDGYDVIAAFTSSSQATTAATSASANHVAIVGGKAVLPITDNGTGVGTNVYAITFDKRVSAGGFAGSPVTIAGTFNVVIAAAADATAGTVALANSSGYAALAQNTAKTAYVLGAVSGGDTAAPLSTDDFGAYDGRAVLGTLPTQTVAGPTVFGTVTSKATATSAAVAIPSAAVTVSGAGLQFEGLQSAKAVWATDSLSLVADASGHFYVNVYSHKVGKQLVTVTSGAGSAVVEVNFVATAAKTAAKTITVTAPALTQSGRAVDAVVTLTDKYGNPIDTTATGNTGGTFTISTTGAGYANGTVPTNTDAKGQASIKLVYGYGETGDSVITASYDADGTATTYSAVSASTTITSNVTDANVDIVNNRVTAVATFTKGKTVSFYVDGIKKWSKASASDADVVVNYNLKKGTHTVSVKISGGFSTVEKFIVK